jgi:orotate phosphoribosyltransferase
MPEPPAELAARIHKRARLMGEFQLRSGAVSEEYFDKYLFESDPRLPRELLSFGGVDIGATGGWRCYR